LIKDLRKLVKVNGAGYLFLLTGGEKPVTIRHIYNGLNRALKRMGLSDEEIKERSLNVYVWRHFCNTEMLNAGIPLNPMVIPRLCRGYLTTRKRQQILRSITWEKNVVESLGGDKIVLIKRGFEGIATKI
jgi:integrase